MSEVKSADLLIAEFRQTCRRVRDGCNFDISKCFADGKPLIIDGSHVDPSCYVTTITTPEGNKEHRIVTEITPAEQKGALQAMQEKMQKINQSGSLIIPFLLTIDPVSHSLCVESRLSMLLQKHRHVSLLYLSFRGLLKTKTPNPLLFLHKLLKALRYHKVANTSRSWSDGNIKRKTTKLYRRTLSKNAARWTSSLSRSTSASSSRQLIACMTRS
jgi:hypothetical protein